MSAICRRFIHINTDQLKWQRHIILSTFWGHWFCQLNATGNNYSQQYSNETNGCIHNTVVATASLADNINDIYAMKTRVSQRRFSTTRAPQYSHFRTWPSFELQDDALKIW